MNRVLNIQKYCQNALLVLLLMFSFYIGFIPKVYANPVCSIKAGTNCNTGETALLRTSSSDNAHAGTLADASFSPSYSLCCSESTAGVTVGTSNAGAGLVKLIGADNSHVASWAYPDSSSPSYPGKIYITASTGNYTCTTTAPGGACDTGSCVAKISIDSTLSNGHIADCALGNGNYSSVCCKYNADIIILPKLKVRLMRDIIIGLINWLLGISAGLAVLFIIYGGIRYITAAGDEAKIGYAKKIVNYAILGLFIIGISFVIVKTIGGTIAN